MSQHRTSFSSQQGFLPTPGESFQSRRTSSSSSSIDELLTPSPGPSISNINTPTITSGGASGPLSQTVAVLSNTRGGAWPKYRGSFSQDGSNGDDASVAGPITTSINQDIWKSTWSASTGPTTQNSADAHYRTTSGSSGHSESSFSTARRTSNGMLIGSETAENRRSTSLFGLTPSNNEPQQTSQPASLLRSLSGGSPFFPTGAANLSVPNTTAAPSTTEGRNILDRFAYLGEATREMEMLNGFRKMSVSTSGAVDAPSSSSLTSPYVSPTPTYAAPAGVTGPSGSGSLFGTTTAANSRSSSFGNGVWQPMNLGTVTGNPAVDDEQRSYPPEPYGSTMYGTVQQQPQQMYRKDMTFNDDTIESGLSAPSAQQRHLSYSAVAAASPSSDAPTNTSQPTTSLAPTTSPAPTTSSSSNGSFRSQFAFQNFQNAVKFVPKNGPVAIGEPGVSNNSYAVPGYGFTPGATAGPAFKSRNTSSSGSNSGQAINGGNSSGGGSRRKAHGDSSANRSPLLEEFRNNKNRKFTLADLHDHAVEFSTDQHGSRFIQHKLESALDEEKDALFSEIRPHSLQLMTDVFGNYVIQKFFELGSDIQRTILAKQMETHVLDLSLQMYGCRVVQKAIEYVPNDQQIKLVKELEGHVLRCVKDQNGNHVIQKAIERIRPELITFIMDSFHDQIYQLATHPYGCRVIQRMLEYSSEQAQRELLDELHTYAFYLVEDQYGNYVIQHVIEHGNKPDKDKVIDLVKNSIMTFSRHKFASNVVEKCIIFGSDLQKRQMIDVILTSKSDGTVPISVMMKDQFANYVIQKLLDSTSGDEHDRLVISIKPHLNALKKFSYGKHLASIEKLVEPEDSSEGGSVSGFARKSKPFNK